MEFWTFLSVGTVSMLLTMFIIAKDYNVKLWKWLLITFLLTGAGVLGTKIMAFIENGSFGSRSFFGAIFFTPLIMILVAFILKMPYQNMLDLCAPCECAMLTVMKLDCSISGCCKGYIMYYNSTGVPVRFPSQIVECINALILCIVLIIMIKRKKQIGFIYYWYMILYGISRFILNLFRETTPFVWILPAGNFWALISTILGIALLLISKRKTQAHSEVK